MLLVICRPHGRLFYLLRKRKRLTFVPMKKVMMMLACCLLVNILQAQKYMLVGTYTTAGSYGIYVFRFNNGSPVLVDSVQTANPSFLTVSADEKYVYAVSETADRLKGGSILSFSFDKTSGKLSPINAAPSGGNNPCYVAADKTGKWVFAGNYSSGSLCMLRSQKGKLDTVQVIQHDGSSVNEERQGEAHVHATVLSPDEKFLYVPDLGMDKIMIYTVDKKAGNLVSADPPFEMVGPGNGPRHLSFHPNKKFVYLVEELSGSISAYAYNKKDGSLFLLQNISAIPADYMGNAGSADIHVSPDGKFLYVSNRGESNTLGIFSINEKTGMLSYADHEFVLGKTPRNFNISPNGKFLVVANQGTDNIIVFRRNSANGALEDTGSRVKLSRPVCIQWIGK